MELKKVQGDNIPKVIEYLGMNEWAVRWDIEEVNSEDIHGYAYYELKFNEEPTYDSFVSKIIRTKYSADEEAALKSDMVEQLLSGSQPPSRFDEWQSFHPGYRKISRLRSFCCPSGRNPPPDSSIPPE